MKRLLYIIVFSALLTSCVKDTGSGDGDAVMNPPSCILTVEIEGYGDSHIWSRNDKFGIYGSMSGENVRYVVETTSFESDGKTRIYGSGADGQITAYFPYTSSGYAAVAAGKQPLFASQTYNSTGENQLKASTVLVARAENDNLNFTYGCGVLNLNMAIDMTGTVTHAVLSSESKALCGNLALFGDEPAITDPGNELTVDGIGLPCTPQEPMQVRFMLPPGTYSDLYITLVSDTESITKPVEAVLTISAKVEEKCTVTNKETIYEGSDVIIVEGVFDEEKGVYASSDITIKDQSFDY